MKQKLTLPIIIMILAMLNTLLYVVAKNMPAIIGSFFFFWGPLTLLTIFLYNPKSLFNGPIKYFWFYGIISLVILQYLAWGYMDDWNRKALITEFYAIIVFIAIWNYFYFKNDFQGLTMIARWSFIFIIITLITTNIALTIDPLIVRNSVGGYSGDITQLGLAEKFGSAGYGYAQGFILLIPVLLYFIKKKFHRNRYRLLYIIALALVVLVTLRANVFGNLLALLFIAPLAIMGYKRRQYVIRYLIFVGFIYIVIPNWVFSDFFYMLSTYFEPNSEMHAKLIDFSSFVENQEIEESSMAGGRAARYPLLLDAFFSNPLLGYASADSTKNIGEGAHLYWMNRLTQWGLIGFIIFIKLMYETYSKIMFTLKDEEMKYYYKITVLVFIFMGLTKNIAGREPWAMLIVVIPGLFYLNQQTVKQKV